MNIFKLVARNITRRKGRFIFTLLGITVGMASFVALLSLGGNMRGEMTKQAGSLGAQLIITPKNWCAYDQISILTGNSLPESLQQEVLDDVSAIEGITAVPYLTLGTSVNNQSVLLTGILPQEMKDFKGWEVEQGEWFSSQDERAVVLGSGIADPFELSVGDTVTIRGETLPVKAILQETGGNDDTSLYMPLSVAQELYEVEGFVSYLAAQVDDMSKMEEYEAAILGVANVAITSDKQLLSTVLSMLGSVNLTLQMIAMVSLIAAAFGIINTMMTAITERRREIGIMRAIGGNGNSIFKIFLIESGLYGLLGGIAGVALGLLASFFIAPMISESDFAAFLKGAEFEASFDPTLMGLSILFSIIISIGSGFYPAWRAAKLTPVEAITHE
ncbi:MAG: ABC transporter permease [Oscillospiraceae bacterium]|nr:ABC transporter permease [Oscillospiraceae bacterium]